jgi:hypothetical protein
MVLPPYSLYSLYSLSLKGTDPLFKVLDCVPAERCAGVHHQGEYGGDGAYAGYSRKYSSLAPLIINDLIKTIEANKAAQRVRWSIDIDPQELY